VTNSLLNPSQSLLTPDLKNLSQNFFNGENWFCYWKASATLWQTKLEQYRGASPLLVPFLWSHHVSRVQNVGAPTSKTVIDFGQKRQDTNINEIFHLVQQMGLEAVLVIPLGPLPFVSAGGIPSWLCEAVTQDEQRLNKVAVDEQGRIHKSYSFYSPRVFREYINTLSICADLLRTKGIPVRVFSMNSFYEDPVSHNIKPFFEDHSSVAEQAFARYFASLKEVQSSEPDIKSPKATPEQWQVFHEQMKKLYLTSIQEIFAGFYQGEMNVLFGGASSWQPLSSMSLATQPTVVLDTMKKAWQNSMIPSFVTSSQNQQEIQKVFQSTCPHDWIKDFIISANNQIAQTHYVPLHLMKVVGQQSVLDGAGLSKILNHHYHGTWGALSSLSNEELDSWEDPKTLFIFDSFKVDEKESHSHQDVFFNFLIKMVMRGHQIAINREALTENQMRLFEQFVVQNQLMKIFVGHYCPLEFVSIGFAGKLCLFNASEVQQSTKDLQQAFWKQILRLFNVEFVPWLLDEPLEALWMVRASSVGDLYYEQIRRVVLRNKSFDEKVFTFPKDKKHILVKIVDPTGVEVITKPNALELRFSSLGHVVLDFGFIGEMEQGSL
jgi:hypothetical protein